ncbi:MAG: hypothetical protein ACFCU3_02345 [Verrucomicrobiales bacterium]
MKIPFTFLLGFALCLLLITAEASPDYMAEVIPELDFTHQDSTDTVGPFKDWQITATSTLDDQKGNSYAPAQVFDGEKETAWVEGVSGPGIGQRINFRYPATMDRPFTCWGFSILNGYTKNQNTWRNNARVKTLKVWQNHNLLGSIALHDTMHGQAVRVSMSIQPGDLISFEIAEVYPGSKFEDTAISELHFQGLVD